MMDADDKEGYGVYDKDTAVKMMNEFNECREPNDEEWRWAYIKVVDEQTENQVDIITK
jgi:hypothetical protein